MFYKLFSAIILGVRNFRVFEILEHLPYLCYYCDVKSDTFQCIIELLTSFHKQECLKYRELELNEVTGSASYRTKAHSNIIPADGDIVVALNRSPVLCAPVLISGR